MTVNPAINLFGGNFGTNVRYTLNIDTNGDNGRTSPTSPRFGDQDSNGTPSLETTKYTGRENILEVEHGKTVAGSRRAGQHLDP